MTDKCDDVLELRRDQSVDVSCLVETWHDSDSVSICRLRAQGFVVVDRPRPRLSDDLSTNHGGIIAFAPANIQLSILPVANPPSFELLCVRVTSGRTSEVLAVIYRPGSQPVQWQFFDDLSTIFEQVRTYSSTTYVVGDFNVRLDRPDDPHAQQFRSLVAGYGFHLAASSPTHRRGGTLDALASTTAVDVRIVDAGISDHHAVCWRSKPVLLSSISPSCTDFTRPVLVRSWRQLDRDKFRAAIATSRLCRPENWPIDIDELAALYNDEFQRLLDALIPLHASSYKRRRSDPWFDDECRAAKRATRRLEHAFAASDRRCHWPTSSGTDIAAAAAAKAAWYSQRRTYRLLRYQKCQEFWRRCIDINRSNPRQLWQTVDQLMGRCKLQPSHAISADQFIQFFRDKVQRVRDTTTSSSPPVFIDAPRGADLPSFAAVSAADVAVAIGRLPDKSSAADPMPTSVLKSIADLVAPFIAELFSRSLAKGYYPADFKRSFITPIIKQTGLDASVTSSYRPITNLSVLSKLFERMVARQLVPYLNDNNLLPSLQSGFRASHSTETAILHVFSDILSAVDRGEFAALVLLDLSAAFDTVDHQILLERMQRSFGITGTAHRWFTSYLTGRSLCVRRDGSESEMTAMLCGVPQGSVLGPLLFVLYTADLQSLIEQHGLMPHLYADDTQIYGFCRPDNVEELTRRITDCVADVAAWMCCNRLQLNVDKTNLLWCTSSRRMSQLPTEPLSLAGHEIVPSTSVRDLGVFIDADLTMHQFVSVIVSRCFAALRQLRAVRRYVSASVMQSLVTSLILTRLDYCNSVLFGLPAIQIRRLQAVQNAAARLVFGIRRSEHISDALISMHWLRVTERIRFKIAVMVYKSLHGSSPCYLSSFVPCSSASGRTGLRSAASHRLLVPRYRLSTVGARSFLVAGANIWNGLSLHVVSAPSLTVFRSRLKTFLFSFSYRGAVI